MFLNLFIFIGMTYVCAIAIVDNADAPESLCPWTCFADCLLTSVLSYLWCPVKPLRGEMQKNSLSMKLWTSPTSSWTFPTFTRLLIFSNLFVS